jgi:hypothetical protein
VGFEGGISCSEGDGERLFAGSKAGQRLETEGGVGRFLLVSGRLALGGHLSKLEVGSEQLEIGGLELSNFPLFTSRFLSAGKGPLASGYAVGGWGLCRGVALGAARGGSAGIG